MTPLSESAFPELPENPDSLPAVPGGWIEDLVDLEGTTLSLQRPADPDLFLEDEQVHAESAKRDYMPYWAFLWPASEQMANAVLQASWPVGSEVLELGAGLGLVGLAALHRGDRVIFSDYDPTALHLCRLNARRNNLPEPELLQLDWTAPPARRFPVLLGCEIIYDGGMHETILNLIERMLTPDGICWIGDPGRSQAEPFCQMARSRGFALRVFNRDRREVDAISAEGFQILQISRTLK